MFRKIFFSFFFIFFASPILAMKEEIKNDKIIIYIHGVSFPEPHHPFIDFFKKTKELSSININKPGKFGAYELSSGSPFANFATHTFYWNRTKEEISKWETKGILSKKGRYEAAQYLFKYLTKYHEDKEISICALSHGGNVATELLRIIGEKKSGLKVKNLIFYETPKGELTERGIHTKVKDTYVAEHVFDINLDYKPNYTSQQEHKAIQVIDIFHQFPRCFRTFLKKRDNLKDILLNGECLDHNSIHHIGELLRDLLNKGEIKENYEHTFLNNKKIVSEKFNAKLEKSFHANNRIFQYFCYYILPYLITSLKGAIIYKLLMRYDKKYNLGIKENLINQINLLKNKYKTYS